MFQERRSIIFIFLAVLLFLAIIIGIFLYLRSVKKSAEKTENEIQLIKSELFKSSGENAEFRNAVAALINDTAEIRSYLSLPERTYPFFTEDSQGDFDSRRNAEPYFLGMERILEEYDTTQKTKLFSSFLRSESFMNMLSEIELTAEKTSSTTCELVRGGTEYFTVTLSQEDAYILSAPFGVIDTDVSADNLPSVIKENLSKVENHIKTVKDMMVRFQTLPWDQEIKELLNKKNLDITRPEENKDSYIILIKKESFILIALELEKKTPAFIIDSKRILNFEDFRKKIITALEEIDPRTPEEKLADESKKMLIDLHSDKGFTAALVNNELTLSSIFREDSDYFYLDLLDREGKAIGSYAVYKRNGLVYLMDFEGIPISGLRSLGIESGGVEDLEKKN